MAMQVREVFRGRSNINDKVESEVRISGRIETARTSL